MDIVRRGFESIPFPNQQRRPLPSLLSDSYSKHATTMCRKGYANGQAVWGRT